MFMETATRRTGGLTRGMRAALTEAMAMRRDGAPRESGLACLAAAGFNEALAAMIMDHCDDMVVARAAGRKGTSVGAAAAKATPNMTFESRRQRSHRMRR